MKSRINPYFNKGPSGGFGSKIGRKLEPAKIFKFQDARI